MTTDDYLLSQIERTEQEKTKERREKRRGRRRRFLLVSSFSFVLLVVALPSLVSHSSIGRSLVSNTADSFGFDIKTEEIRIGWVTPLKVSGLSLKGRTAGSTLEVKQIDTEITLLDVISSRLSDLKTISVRGVDVHCKVLDGTTSVEEDLKAFLAPKEQRVNEDQSTDHPSPMIGHVDVNDVTVTVTDAVTGETWKLTQANVELELLTDSLTSTFTGVLAEPRGSQGSLQGSIALGLHALRLDQTPPWQIELACDSLPISAVSLARRRLPEYGELIPAQVGGDATGKVAVHSTSDGVIKASMNQLQLRNFVAANLGNDSRRWANKLAVLDGAVSLVGDRVIGESLMAKTDFASAKLDGAFSTSITLVGASDNPVRWLDALEGAASAELDLAAFDNAMPGILPLRNDAELVSGFASASIESLPSRDARRRRLSLQSDAVRARSRGIAVVIDPIEMTAIVSSNQDRIRAEQFELKSSFAAASGAGDLQKGSTDLEVDFGRLANMLRPIIDLSGTSLAGSARGKIDWKASGNNEWRLTGTGEAKDLLIELAGGNRLRHSALQMNVDAVGKWNNGQLDSISLASAKLSSTGLDLRADLVKGIENLNSNSVFPIQIKGSGRLENLADTLGPWLPAELHDFDGGFSLNARGEMSPSGEGKIRGGTIELAEPRIAYADQFFSQPNIKIQFDGDYDWIKSELLCRSLTIAGDAISAAVKGEMTDESTNFEIAWRAKLERLQGSMKTRIAAQANPLVTPAGFRRNPPTTSDEWVVQGDCEGRFLISTRDAYYVIDTEITGQNFAILQPASAMSSTQTVGPMPKSNASNRDGLSSNPNLPSLRESSSVPSLNSQVIWAEPSVTAKGKIQYDTATGDVLADSLNLASDWFAMSITGHAAWNETKGEILFKGPTRIKMDEVAAKLSAIVGTQVQLEGVHETPVDIQITRLPNQDIAMNIGANLGWESGEVAGVRFGQANIPVRLTETSVFVSRSTIPVDQGSLSIAGDVHYRPGPLWMRIEPGRVAESIRLTPEMTDRWLKYIAPLAADTTRIDGKMGAEIDEGILVFDNPELSRIIGRVNVEQIDMNSGPLTDQLIGGLQQLKSLATMAGPQAPQQNTSSTLIRLPPQTVEFSVDRGVVSHQRLYFDVDRAQVVTSGSVAFDGRLNLTAQVPLDERWLGSSLKGLAGQPVTLPISGTLSRPTLDSSGVRKVVSQLGVQAVQDTAESYLQKQLGKGIEKIFGR